MTHLLAFLGRNAIWVLFLGVFLGFLLPGLASILRPFLGTVVFFLLVFSILRIEGRDFLRHLKAWPLALPLIIWLTFGAPLLFWLLLKTVQLPLPLEQAMVLMASAPPILGAVAIAVVLKLDGALAMLACLASLILAPLTVPPIARYLVGLEVEFELFSFMFRLALLIGSAFATALLVRRLAGHQRLKTWGQQLDGLVMVMMLIFAVAIMDGVTYRLLESPERVILWTLLSFVANPLLQAMGILVFWRFGRSIALTAGLLTGNCNMGLLLATLPQGSDPGIALYFALAQLPMYMLPALAQKIYPRLLPPLEQASQIGKRS